MNPAYCKGEVSYAPVGRQAALAWAPVKPYRALAVTLSAFCLLSSTARRAGSVASFSCARVAVRACSRIPTKNRWLV